MVAVEMPKDNLLLIPHQHFIKQELNKKRKVQ